MSIDRAKEAVAKKAIKHVKDGQIVGLGSGSTVYYFLKELGKLVRNGLNIKGVPTSYHTMSVAVNEGIPMTSLHERPHLDLAVDGADVVDRNLNAIKGKGGALTLEKIVDSSADVLILIVDETKYVPSLEGRDLVIPVEVLPFAYRAVMRKIEQIGGRPVLRESDRKLGPVVTDSGNFLIDAEFRSVVDIHDLNLKLSLIPGVVETGLFLGMADVVYIGAKSGEVKELKRDF